MGRKKREPLNPEKKNIIAELIKCGKIIAKKEQENREKKRRKE